MSDWEPVGQWRDLGDSLRSAIDALAEWIRRNNPNLALSASYFATPASPLTVTADFLIDREMGTEPELTLSCTAWPSHRIMQSDLSTGRGEVIAEGPTLLIDDGGSAPTQQEMNAFVSEFRVFLERHQSIFRAALVPLRG